MRMAVAVVAASSGAVRTAGTSRHRCRSFEGVPGTYTPGQMFTFQVLVPQLFEPHKYNVELVFSTTVPNPPLFVFSTAASPAPSGTYVFPSNATFSPRPRSSRILPT